MSENESRNILNAIAGLKVDMGGLGKRMDQCVHEMKADLKKDREDRNAERTRDREERTKDRAHYNAALQRIHEALEGMQRRAH